MKKAPKLCFALQNAQWVSIKSVSKGLACHCYCPACGAKLIARKGKQQQHHFAHYHGNVCKGSVETALHLLGKQLIAESTELMLSAVQTYQGPQLRASHLLNYQSAQQEVGFKGLIIDVLLRSAGKPLAIELKVSHASSSKKQYLLIKHGLACLEIDLLAIYDELWANGKGSDLEQFKQALLYKETHRNWLFHPRKHKWEFWALKQATLRKVNHSKQADYHHYLVYRCPKNKRFIRNGFREGQSYARVFQDCMHCDSCREIAYQKEWVGFKQVNGKPLVVYCLGEHDT